MAETADGTFTFSDGGSNSIAPFENIETLFGGTGVNTLDFSLAAEDPLSSTSPAGSRPTSRSSPASAT